MPKYEVRWTVENWFTVEIEANTSEQAEAKFWAGKYKNELLEGSEVQDSVEVMEVIEGDN